MSIHLNILTNKSNIRFLKDIMEKNLETEIIEALKSGKEEAFRYIYRTYYTDLCRIAKGYLTDSYLSESIVEDLVYSLWENRSKITINTSLKNLPGRYAIILNDIPIGSDSGQQENLLYAPPDQTTELMVGMGGTIVERGDG